MKIIVQHQGKMRSDLEERIKNGDMDEELAFDTTPFDVPGWVSIEVGGVSVAEVHINDLAPAMIAIKAEYNQRMERE